MRCNGGTEADVFVAVPHLFRCDEGGVRVSGGRRGLTTNSDGQFGRGELVLILASGVFQEDVMTAVRYCFPFFFFFLFFFFA